MIPKFDYYKQLNEVESSDEIKPGLEAIEQAMELLGHPQLAVPVIHVAGTNGKGSTIKMMERLLQTHGLKTATFMSPCINDVHDQIQFNGESITEQQMNKAFQYAKECGLSGMLTDFELLTAIAFTAISQENPHIAIIESGLGGRFDSTNVVNPIVSVIPSIALEHTAFLGDTIEKIATHKAGIIKEGKRAVIGELPLEAEKVMRYEAVQKNCALKINGIDFSVDPEHKWHNGELEFTELDPSLKGEHQVGNMAVAIQAFLIVAEQLDIEPNELHIREAVASTTLAGRFEQISSNVWMDGAHNPASAKMLKETIQQQFQFEKVTMIVGILKDKDVRGVLRQLEEVSDHFIFVEVEREKHRLMNPQALLDLSVASHKSVSNSVLEAVQSISSEQKIIITGSLYLLAQWRSILKENLV